MNSFGNFICWTWAITQYTSYAYKYVNSRVIYLLHPILVGALEHLDIFPFSWECRILPTDIYSIIFQRGRLKVETTKQIIINHH